MFEERQSCPVVSQSEEDKVYPYDLSRAELYFPTRKDIIQSNTFSDLISVEASPGFQVEFSDERKATEEYVSYIKGATIMNKVSKTERVEYRCIDARNSISESLYASSTVGLKVGYTICLDHCAAEVQFFSNNDFVRIHAWLVTISKWKNEQVDKPIGFFYLCPE